MPCAGSALRQLPFQPGQRQTFARGLFDGLERAKSLQTIEHCVHSARND
jgi:hypothetical protein